MKKTLHEKKMDSLIAAHNKKQLKNVSAKEAVTKMVEKAVKSQDKKTSRPAFTTMVHIPYQLTNMPGDATAGTPNLPVNKKAQGNIVNKLKKTY